MKLALCSDLHIDFRDLSNTFYENSQGVDALVMAGDTIESRKLHSIKPVFDKLSKLYPKVILISGNHEFYGSEVNESKQHIRDLTSNYDNVIYLDDEFLNLPNDYVLVGSTLWTDYNKNNPLTMLWAQTHMNDYKHIRVESNNSIRLHPKDCYDYHISSKGFIRESVESNKDKKVIVITHHAPSFQSVDKSFRSEVHGNGCYASNLDEFILANKNIVLWQHGHMHHPKNYFIGTCRVVCHPRGYPDERRRDKDYYYDYGPLVVEV